MLSTRRVFLSISFDDPRTEPEGLQELILTALREQGMLGSIEDQRDNQPNWTFDATVLLTADDRLAVVRIDGRLTSGAPLSDAIQAVTGATDATIIAEDGEGLFEASSPGDGDEDGDELDGDDDDDDEEIEPDPESGDGLDVEADIQPGVEATPPVVVGRFAADDAGLMANQLASALTFVPLGEWGVLVPRSAELRATPWSKRNLPVVEISESENFWLHVAIYSENERVGGFAERAARAMVPNWVGSWVAARLPIQPEQLAPSDSEAGKAQAGTLVDDMSVTNQTVPAAFALDAEQKQVLDRLTVQPAGPEVLPRLLELLGLPTEVLALVRGEVDADELPDVRVIDDIRLCAAIRDGTAAVLSGDSFMARWWRVPLERPGLAALVWLGILLLAGGALWLGVADASPLAGTGWAVAATVVGIVLVLDVVVDASIVAVRRRRHRRRRAG